MNKKTNTLYLHDNTKVDLHIFHTSLFELDSKEWYIFFYKIFFEKKGIIPNLFQEILHHMKKNNLKETITHSTNKL